MSAAEGRRPEAYARRAGQEHSGGQQYRDRRHHGGGKRYGSGQRERHGRALLVAAGGLALVAAVLLSTVLTTGVPGAAGTGRTVTRDTAPGAAASPAGHGVPPEGAQGRTHTVPRSTPATPSGDPGPERCADGEYPAASLEPSGASGPAVDRITERGRLVVGVDQNGYLWGYRDPASGNIEGFDIDIVRATAEDLLGRQPDVTYRTIPTNRRMRAVRDGEVDTVVRTMTVNCERRAEVAFSTACFEAGRQLVVPSENARVTGFGSSMRGKRLCVADGSTAEALMQRTAYREPGAKPVVVDNQLDCPVRMQLGRTGATLTDNALGTGQVAQDPSVELTGEPRTIEPYGVAMNPKDKDLVRRVNKVLEDYRESKWQSSYEKWLGGDMMGTDDSRKPAPPEPKYRD